VQYTDSRWDPLSGHVDVITRAGWCTASRSVAAVIATCTAPGALSASMPCSPPTHAARGAAGDHAEAGRRRVRQRGHQSTSRLRQGGSPALTRPGGRREESLLDEVHGWDASRQESDRWGFPGCGTPSTQEPGRGRPCGAPGRGPSCWRGPPQLSSLPAARGRRLCAAPRPRPPSSRWSRRPRSRGRRTRRHRRPPPRARPVARRPRRRRRPVRRLVRLLGSRPVRRPRRRRHGRARRRPGGPRRRARPRPRPRGRPRGTGPRRSPRRSRRPSRPRLPHPRHRRQV
jgi:hypothetical protein